MQFIIKRNMLQKYTQIKNKPAHISELVYAEAN